MVGVDTHRSTHAVVAISALGALLGSLSIPANSRGYRTLLDWARSLGPIRAFGVEGTGAYGAGLTRFLSEHGHPLPASSGKTNRHRLNRGGNRQAAAALYRVVIVRMWAHQPTLDYVRRRTNEGTAS
ncbi:IS110 family transposase [Roseomonas mucosa]|uniref:IS110 family transposase n=1 Tax=Roseomonas mucosa TaxID=207340 RepID=UPI001AD6D5B1|nr:transposase [Acetobacteraceae bacterium]